jgi:phospho-N-acetylmuramoyl-pentapeptide-transferase
MLHALIVALERSYPQLNAFTYLSSRLILSLMTAILISMTLYPPVIRWLRSIKLGQPIRELGPASHFEKKGTPTMGGLIILLATLASTLLWGDLGNHHLWTLFFVAASFGAVGFLDDFLKISKRSSDGLSSRLKMFGLVLASCIALAWHYYVTTLYPEQSAVISFGQVNIPFLKDTIVNLGFWYFPFALLVMVGTSNAVNLTDGLDGLVIGPVMTCAAALTVLSYVTGHFIIAKYLYYHTVPFSGEIIVFLAAVIGSSIGFLWYNTWPAQVFMGDSGSLPLGGILATVAIITGHEILLVVMGGIFVVEAISVILQVGSYKLTKKRIFKMAPLHHHYEKAGWPEQKITIRAWIISLMLALFSILSLKLR